MDNINNANPIFKTRKYDMRFLQVGSGVLSVILASASFADDLSYSYIGAGYQMVEVLDNDFDGYTIGGSAALNESLFVIASYAGLSSKDEFITIYGADELELTQFSAGLGFHTPINTNTDFVSSLSYVSSETEIVNISEDSNGIVMRAGFRSKPTNKIELGASIDYAKIEDESDVGFSTGVQLFVVDSTSLGVTYSTAEDTDSIALSARFDI